MSKSFKSDVRFIKLALQLAKRGLGQTGSNPSVGCIIVKNKQIIGRGVTGPQGTPHAEIVALTQAGKEAKGATMFVTLEPCTHQGKNPPCVRSIINAKISRVVCPLVDPDPRVSGNGFANLKQAKIKVDFLTVARAWAEEINKGFLSRITKGRPFITVKLGISIDGKIASKSGESRWITNQFSRARAHLLRVQNDAILVGTTTLLKDSPKLNARGTLSKFSNPLRVFLDRKLKIFPSKSILKNISQHPSLIVYGEKANLNNSKIWENAGVESVKINSDNTGIDLNHLFQTLGQRGINSVLVEGGGKLAKSLLETGLIDELIVYRSGLIIGSDGIPSFFEFEKISQEIESYPRMFLKHVNRLDSDLETIWRPFE